MSKEYRMSIALDASGASSGIDNVAKAFASLEKYLASMDKTLTGIESALSNTGKVTSQLSDSLDSTAKAADGAQKGLKNAAKSVDDLANQSEQAEKKQKELADAFEKVALAAGVAFGAVSFAIKGAITDAADFEKAMAGVKKVIDFESPAQFKQMEQDIISMSQRLPMAAADIAAIMEAAGQSGIARDELSRFAESAVKMGVAFDITAEEAGTAMAEMRASFKLSQAEVEELADQINYLGNTTTNSAPQIMEVVQRIGSLAETANISSSTLAALSASLVGVAPEVAATSLKNFALQLVKGESLSKSAKEAFEAMGLDYNQVAQDMQKDSEATIRKVIEAAQKVPEHMRAAVLDSAFGSESIAAISQLITNYEMVDKNLKAMGDSATYAGSMLKEFEGMAGTSAAQMQLFNNNIQAVKIAFGTAFLPVLNQAMAAMTPVLKSITEWAQKNPELVATITGIATAVLGAVAALGGLALAFSAVTSGIGAIVSIGAGVATIAKPLMDAIGIVRMFGSALAALGFPMTAVVVGIAALVTAGVLLYQNWDTIKAKADEVWSAVSSKVTEVVANVKAEFEELKAKAEAIFNSLPAPARAALSAIGAVFSAQFGVIKTVVSTSFALIKNTFTTVFAAIKALVRGDMEGVKQAINNGMRNAWNIVRNGVTNIASAFKDLGVKLRQAGRDAVQGFINGVDEKIDAAVAKFRELASRAKGAVTGFLDINSPSRVMKQIGEWVAEGFALGIAAKTPLATKAAKNMAEAAKNEIANLERSILVNTLKLKGDPNAEFTADVVSGKYGNAKTLDKLYQTKQQALNIEQQVKAAESFNSTINDLKRQIALMGNSDPIKELAYDLQNTDKYAGYTVEQIKELEEHLKELDKAKIGADFSSELKGATDGLNKQQYLLNNIGDKYAELRYTLAQKGFDTSQIDHIVSTTKQSDTMAQFRAWDAKNRDDALNADPSAKLKAEFDAEMALITSFNEQKLLSEQEYLQRKSDLEAQFDAQSQALKVASYESQLSLASSLAKDLLGETSRAYKAIFAVEKGMAIAQVLLKNKVALANAWASAPFPKNMPAVFKTAMETGALASAVSAIRPVIGQAHDGIMSVPKSGTWNLEKGERVLPQHTAKALDAKLDSMGNGGINITINVASDGSSTIDAQGASQTAKAMADRIKTVVLETLRQERKQGGLLYA